MAVGLSTSWRLIGTLKSFKRLIFLQIGCFLSWCCHKLRYIPKRLSRRSNSQVLVKQRNCVKNSWSFNYKWNRALDSNFYLKWSISTRIWVHSLGWFSALTKLNYRYPFMDSGSSQLMVAECLQLLQSEQLSSIILKNLR